MACQGGSLISLPLAKPGSIGLAQAQDALHNVSFRQPWAYAPTMKTTHHFEEVSSKVSSQKAGLCQKMQTSSNKTNHTLCHGCTLARKRGNPKMQTPSHKTNHTPCHGFTFARESALQCWTRSGKDFSCQEKIDPPHLSIEGCDF